MANVQFFSGEQIPLEMHKVRIVQKLNLPPVEHRLQSILNAGCNTFLLRSEDIFLDMLTDSGVNAMSDQQLAAMMVSDDSYAGSQSFSRLEKKVREIFGMEFFLPAHQGRACEHLLAQALIKSGQVVPMNFHFTTAKAHIVRCGGRVEELLCAEGLEPQSDHPFKGNFDLVKLRALIEHETSDNIAFIRLEAGTNLIGGQPFSLQNAREVCALAREHGIITVMDASLLQDNLHFIKQREAACREMTIREITRTLADCVDVIYFSARKLGFARGGGICLRDDSLWRVLREMVTLFEGFLTYGGISVRELEAMAVGLEETMDEDVIAQGPQFIEFMVQELQRQGVPVVTPAGGLGCHLNAREFLPHLSSQQYPGGALAVAAFIAGGIRGMERGTLSEQREPDGSEHPAEMELLRLAVPRRVFTLSQVKYAIDRIVWLHQQRHLIGGLRFVEEPKELRFFFGRLEPLTDWPQQLADQFHRDFGTSL